MRQLDVDYVLVLFGGLSGNVLFFLFFFQLRCSISLFSSGYASDDINKFLWMVRIAGSTDPNVKEMDYYTKNGEFRVDAEGSPTLLNSLVRPFLFLFLSFFYF